MKEVKKEEERKERKERMYLKTPIKIGFKGELMLEERLGEECKREALGLHYELERGSENERKLLELLTNVMNAENADSVSDDIATIKSMIIELGGDK